MRIMSNGSIIMLNTLTTAGEKKAIVTKNSNYAATATDQIILCDATAGAFTVTLPTAIGNNGQQYTFKKIDATTNGITINTSASQTIDGNASNVLSTQNASVTLSSDGANWKIIGGGSSSSSITNIDNGEQAYSGTISNWVGTTPPSGALTASYRWTQTGKNVIVYLWLKYATAGTSISGFDATLPSDLPLPYEPATMNAVNDVMYIGVANLSGALSANTKVGLIKTGTGTYKFQVVGSSTSSVTKFTFEINYTAQ